jgi:Ca-activated chloride channel family protein
MADEFFLECRVDQPAVLAGQSADLHVLTTVRPNPAVLGALMEPNPGQALPAHLIVLVDVSGSMQEIIRPDPDARIVGSGTAEGQPIHYVETTVPTRLAVAQGVVRRLVERMALSDRLTLVAFDHQAHVLLAGASALNKGEMLEGVAQLGRTGGGGTSLGRGLQAVLKATSGLHEEGTRRLVLLTDGKDQEPDLALEQAQVVATNHHIPIHALGTGECRADFLKQVAQASGAFDYLFSEDEAESCFDRVFASQKNILATGVTLSFWLSPEVHAQYLYRTRPEILYLGALRPNARNTVNVPVEYLERGKVYEFLFRVQVPARAEGGRFRLARASLAYDLPARAVTGARAEANVVVEFTDNAAQAQGRVGDVRRVIAQAEVQRQVLSLQEKIDAIERGTATPPDRATVARLLDVLVRKYQEFGDQANVNLYRGMLADFQRKGTISQEMLNRSLAASSRPQESAPALLLDDF